MAPKTRNIWQTGAIGFGLWLLPASSAWAAEPPIELSWQAPPECPSREAVLTRMRRMLGSSWSKLAPLRASGVIERTASGFALRLSIEEGKGGQRDVFAQRCDELGGVAAVALVLLLTTSGHLDSADVQGAEPLTGEAGSAGGAANDAGGQRVATPPEEKEQDEEDEEEPSDNDEPSSRGGHRLRWLVDAPLFGLGIGPLPRPYPAVGLGFGAQRGALSVRVVGQWGLAQEIPANAGGSGVEVRRASAGLWACAEVWRGSVDVSPCLQASLTHIFGRGYGPMVRSMSRTETSAAVGAALLGRWRIHDHWAVLLGVAGQAELSRPVLALRPLGVVDQLAPVSATLLLGPEWIF